MQTKNNITVIHSLTCDILLLTNPMPLTAILLILAAILDSTCTEKHVIVCWSNGAIIRGSSSSVELRALVAAPV